MNEQQEILYLEDSTNYMDGEKFIHFKWGMYHLEPFTSETGRPPMQAFDYIMLVETQLALGERITETLNHIPEDFDLDHRIAKIWNPKTKKGGYQKTTIPPYLVPTLERYLKRFLNDHSLFSGNHTAGGLGPTDCIRHTCNYIDPYKKAGW